MSGPSPQADLRALGRQIGSWHMSGGLTGSTTYEWAPGGHFLLQRLEGERDGHPVRGLELIGHDQLFGEAPSVDICSRFYSFADGLTLDYLYELTRDTLTIWGGERGSAAYYRGVFSPDGDTLTGEWVYPGGGYGSTATRITEEER